MYTEKNKKGKELKNISSLKKIIHDEIKHAYFYTNTVDGLMQFYIDNKDNIVLHLDKGQINNFSYRKITSIKEYTPDHHISSIELVTNIKNPYNLLKKLHKYNINKLDKYRNIILEDLSKIKYEVDINGLNHLKHELKQKKKIKKAI